MICNTKTKATLEVHLEPEKNLETKNLNKKGTMSQGYNVGCRTWCCHTLRSTVPSWGSAELCPGISIHGGRGHFSPFPDRVWLPPPCLPPTTEHIITFSTTPPPCKALHHSSCQNAPPLCFAPTALNYPSTQSVLSKCTCTGWMGHRTDFILPYVLMGVFHICLSQEILNSLRK